MITLTEDEVQSMIKSCLNLRDRAIIGVLYDTGIRVAELVAINICNVMKKGNGWAIAVGHKRMDRNIRTIDLTISVPHMSKYLKFLNNYPFDPGKEPLFSTNVGRISIQEVNDIVKLAAERAGIKGI